VSSVEASVWTGSVKESKKSRVRPSRSAVLTSFNEGAITRIRKAAGMDAASSIPGIEFYVDETNTVR